MHPTAQLRTEALDGPLSAAGLRVALFSGNYNCTRDGANNALNRLVAHLLDRGADVRVYSPTTKQPAFAPAGELVSVPSIRIPGRSEYRAALGLPRSIARDVRDFAPNIIHVSAPDWLGTAAQRLAGQMGIPIVASMHTRFEAYFDYYGLGALKTWAVTRQCRFYRASNRVLAPNEASSRHLIAMGIPRERIDIWSRGVEHDVFSPSRRDLDWRRSLGYADDDVILLFLGRIVREKGIACFADTAEELRKRGFGLRPIIIGDGPARRELEQRLGTAVFVGHLEGDQLGRAVASADILLNASLTEAFGNVNLEAMAAGLAVVSADVPSASALITHGVDGYLSEPKCEAFADSIAKLLSDTVARKRAGKYASVTARSYQWSNVLDDVILSYRNLALNS
jgi:glycosyltransferase involved in cell wall biosynthesis